MIKAFVLCVLIALSLISCNQRLTCPAYQSAFIYDKPTQREKFVYFNESTTQSRDILASNSKTITLPARDSSWENSAVLKGPALPQPRRVKKDRYLLLPDKSYKKTMKSLMTVEMKQVLPKIEKDSADIAAELDSAARSITDTLTVTQSDGEEKAKTEEYAITKTKEKYNRDQDIYMWYFRDMLVMPDVRAERMDKKDGNLKSTDSKKSKGEKKKFFKNLFSKKDKPNKDKEEQEKSTVVSDTSSSEKPKEKKSLNPFKKKSKQAETDPKKSETPKKEEDDGF